MTYKRLYHTLTDRPKAFCVHDQKDVRGKVRRGLLLNMRIPATSKALYKFRSRAGLTASILAAQRGR